jgi:cytochrome c oxidase cbb3-type subunit 3
MLTVRLALAGLAAFGLLAQTAPPRRNNFLISRPVPDPAAVERGKAVFVASCGFCHGPNATGGEGPDLVRSAVALRDENGEEIGPVIHLGRPGMPAFPQITEAQVKDIAAFLRYRQQVAIDRGSYEVKNVNTGDPKRGETYFAAHCATCHSVTGDLNGVVSKYEPTALITRILYPKGAKATATVVDNGQTLTGTIEYLDDFEIGLRDDAGAYRGFTRSPALKLTIKDPLEGHEKQMKTFRDDSLHDVLAYLETLK